MSEDSIGLVRNPFLEVHQNSRGIRFAKFQKYFSSNADLKGSRRIEPNQSDIQVLWTGCFEKKGWKHVGQVTAVLYFAQAGMNVDNAGIHSKKKLYST
jgi:hypothetical protein